MATLPANARIGEVMFNHFPGVYASAPLVPYEEEVNGDITYRRYTDGMRCINPHTMEWEEGKVLIFKTETGIAGLGVNAIITRNTKAWDLWANRATATYIPISRQILSGITYS